MGCHLWQYLRHLGPGSGSETRRVLAQRVEILLGLPLSGRKVLRNLLLADADLCKPLRISSMSGRSSRLAEGRQRNKQTEEIQEDRLSVFLPLACPQSPPVWREEQVRGVIRSQSRKRTISYRFCTGIS